MSAHLRVAITVCMISAFLAATVNCLIMGMSILNGYADKYTYNLSQGYLSNLSAMTQREYVAAPICYTAIDQAIDQVDNVTLITHKKLSGGSISTATTTLFNYSNSNNNLVVLLTKYKTTNLKVTMKQSNVNTGMFTVTLEEVLD